MLLFFTAFAFSLILVSVVVYFCCYSCFAIAVSAIAVFVSWLKLDSISSNLFAAATPSGQRPEPPQLQPPLPHLLRRRCGGERRRLPRGQRLLQPVLRLGEGGRRPLRPVGRARTQGGGKRNGAGKVRRVTKRASLLLSRAA